MDAAVASFRAVPRPPRGSGGPWVLPQHGVQEPLQLLGGRVDVRVLADDLVESGRVTVPGERGTSGGRVQTDRAQGEQVTARVDGPAVCLFRRHPGRGSHQLSSGSHCLDRGQPRDAEVNDDGVLRAQNHVGGCDVAMDDPGPVDLFERGQQVGSQPLDMFRGHAKDLAEVRLQRRALDELGRHPVLTVVLAVTEDSRHMRSTDGLGRGDLAPEALEEFVVGMKIGAHHLRGDC